MGEQDDHYEVQAFQRAILAERERCAAVAQDRWEYPKKVTDGTHRCIRCGQIDEEPYHDHAVCVAVGTGDYKGAKLKLTLRADSGFSSNVEAMVSVNQWRKINEILADAPASDEVAG